MKRIWALDGLRGICAISVVVYHALAWRGAAQINSAGMFSVYTFFILSALTLHIVYKESFSKKVLAPVILRFFQNRIARLLPLLLLVSFINLVYSHYLNENVSINIGKFILTGFGVFSLSVSSEVSNATGAWTIAIEILFYLLFPVILVLSSLCTLRQIFATFIVCLVLQNIHTTLIFKLYGLNDYWGNYTIFLSFIAYFSAGILAARIHKSNSFPMALTGFLVILFFSWQSFFYNPDREFLSAWPVGFLAPIVLGVAVWMISGWEIPHLLVPFFKFLGEISYSIYLIHPLVFFVLLRIDYINKLDIYCFLLVFIVSSSLLSYLVYYFYERPSRDYLRNIFSGMGASNDKL